MKKKLLALLFAVVSIPSFAQFNSGGFSLSQENLYYGGRVGMTVGSITGDASMDAKVGMTLGGIVGFRVNNNVPLFIESGLAFSQRGGKSNNLKTTLNYLEIPVLMKYGVEVTDGFAVLPFFGPYFSVAVAGTNKIGDGTSVNVNDQDAMFGKNGVFNRLDMGFKLGCGLEYNMMYFEVGYQFGVADIYKGDPLVGHGNAFVTSIGVNF